MTTGSLQQRTAHEQQWESTDGIDVTRYLIIIKQRWVEVVLVTLMAIVITAAALFLYRSLAPPVYEANATAAIVRTVTNVQFDERFRTAAEDMGTMTDSSVFDSRRAALVALAKSGMVAQQVIDQLRSQLPKEMQTPSGLLEFVKTEMATATGRAGQSDLIAVNVRAESPQLAADIANAWVAVYVQQVNSVYGQVPDDMLGSVEAQLADAQAIYNKAQIDLEGYLTASQIDTLVRQLEAINQTLQSLEQSKVAALNAYVNGLVEAYGQTINNYIDVQTNAQSLAFNKEAEGKLARASAYYDAYNSSQISTFTFERDNFYSQLGSYYEQLLRTRSLLDAAHTLQQQITSGDAAASGSELALQMLNLQIVNAAAGLPTLQLQVNSGQNITNSLGEASLLSQVGAAVSSLENQQAQLEQNIAKLNELLRSGNNFQELNVAVPVSSNLVQAITTTYPSLFQTGDLSLTIPPALEQNFLQVGEKEAAKFLDLIAVSALPTTNAPDSPLATIISQLEEQQNILQGKIEAERARSQQFSRARDLAWESVTALSNKRAELQLARAAANSEMRISSLAVPLDKPVQRISLTISLLLALIVGLLLGVGVAITRELIASNGARTIHSPRPA